MKKVILVFLSLWIISCFREEPQGPEILPNIKIKEYNGSEKMLTSYKFKVLLINFWASWCEPCKEEIPFLNNIYNQYKDKGVMVLGITEDDAKSIKEFIKKIPINYPIIMDDGSISDAFKVIGYPMTYFYDYEGKLLTQTFGLQRQYYFESKIKELINDKGQQ